MDEIAHRLALDFAGQFRGKNGTVCDVKIGAKARELNVSEEELREALESVLSDTSYLKRLPNHLSRF